MRTNSVVNIFCSEVNGEACLLSAFVYFDNSFLELAATNNFNCQQMAEVFIFADRPKLL